MDLRQAQQDMRHGYLSGYPGLAISGLVWLAAGFAGWSFSLQTGALTLFFGGMAIHPLSGLVARLSGRPGTHSKENPLAALALECTILLFIGLFIAYSVFQLTPAWFFPIMLMTIGGRYLVFSTLYGMRIYWAIGAVLALLGMSFIQLGLNPLWATVSGGGIELLGAVLVFLLTRKEPAPLSNTAD
ncbi:DUF7010 family protein [Bowmanella dokdonensis]|uniref:Uncharacterized protein n=1 Tax=Bowmanella dokdonensis TaxID=751969 RepID=A0A939IRD9_9ALTE|nr:hypothetical protein [Bowmanella dokdonensis]MBN7826004.1 hypothetical protein [Bowmanella dokdonensis]